LQETDEDRLIILETEYEISLP